MSLWLLLCHGSFRASPVGLFSVIQMILVFLCCTCVVGFLSLWLNFFTCKCIRSCYKGCHSLSEWMSVSSSYLDSSDSHTSPHSNPLSSEVPANARWFLPGCLPIIWEFLYHHWPGTWHSVHSHSASTDRTWIWGFLLHTHVFN